MIENDKKPYWRDPLIAFGRMSGWVIGPILAALVAGKWLDRKYDTAPFLFLALTGIAFFVSIGGLLKETKKYLKNIKNNEPDTSNNPDQS